MTSPARELYREFRTFDGARDAWAWRRELLEAADHEGEVVVFARDQGRVLRAWPVGPEERWKEGLW